MSKTSFIRIIINSFDLLINPSFSVLEACKYAGFHIPRFCYHELLSVAGNCRMCLVEVANSPKPLASCVTPVVSNMQIFLDTPLVLKARENVLESLFFKPYM
jgi:NADH dehydrogenase/NADH:ubiquinone oxidoreductase subunit G